MKSTKKKNRKPSASSRQSRRISPFEVIPLLHPDKIEIRILHTSAYLFDPDRFAEIRSIMEKELHVKWRRPTQPESLSKWTWPAVNDDVRITFIGTTAHLEDRTAWLSKPFPSSEDLSDELLWWSYIGLIRLTSKTNDPVLYLKYVSKFLELIERIGIYEVPRIIEIAADVPNDREGRRLAMSVRLKRENPLELRHFRIGYDNRVFEGPSADGLREYTNFRKFPGNDVWSEHRNGKRGSGRLQLKVYPSEQVRPGTDDIRIEMALGPRRLRELLKSPTLAALQEQDDSYVPGRSYVVKSVSPTLHLLGFIEYLFLENILVEDLDEENLRRKYTVLRYQHLNNLSIRGKRFRAVSMGLTPAQFESCTARGQFPQVKALYPDQYQQLNNHMNLSLIKGTLAVQTPPEKPSLTGSYSAFRDITQNPTSSLTANGKSSTYVPKSEAPAETILCHSNNNSHSNSTTQSHSVCTENNKALVHTRLSTLVESTHGNHE